MTDTTEQTRTARGARHEAILAEVAQAATLLVLIVPAMIAAWVSQPVEC